jgi:hypothetical protein
MNASSDRFTTNSAATPAILLIGSGRLAKHLLHWNSLLEKPNRILTWDRSQDPHAINRFLNQTSVVWLAISDAAIVPFFEKYLIGHDHTIVHFSGALLDERMICAHPMMSFPLTMLPDSVYKTISFGLTGASSLSQILPGFQNLNFQISPNEKSLYHALCVVSGNFPQMLWTAAEKEFSKINVPAKAFETYITQVLNNYVDLKEAAITGPLIRKDLATIEKNLFALSGTKLKSIYHAFVKEFLP